MNDAMSDRERTEQGILLDEISDEALETAADPGAGRPCFSFSGGDCTTIPACFPR